MATTSAPAFDSPEANRTVLSTFPLGSTPGQRLEYAARLRDPMPLRKLAFYCVTHSRADLENALAVATGLGLVENCETLRNTLSWIE